MVREEDGHLVSRLDFVYNPQQVAPARLEGMVRGLEEIGKGYGLRVFDDFNDTRLARERHLQELPDAKWHVLAAQTDLKREIAPGREWSQDARHLAQFMQPEPKGQAQQPAAPVQAVVEAASPTPQPTPASAGPDTPGAARVAELGSERPAATGPPAQTAPRPEPAPAGGVGELLVRWQQQGDQVAPLAELRAYLDSLKQAGVAVGAMQLERGPEGKLRGQFGLSYDPAAPDLAPLEGAVQGLKKVGHGLEVVEAPAQATARRQGLSQEGQERALDLAFPVREAFGIRQWDALSAQLSQVPPAALTAPERTQQQAGATRVAQVAEQQGKTHEQVVREGKSLLLDVDTSGNPVSAFLRNFYEHLHGAPKTRQTLEVDYEQTRQQLQARLTHQAGSAPVPGLAVPTPAEASAPAPAVAGPGQGPAPAPVATAAVAVPRQPTPRFTAEELPTEKLALFGLNAEQLAERGQLHKLLSGQKTDLLSMKAGGEQPGREPMQFDGKLLLHREANGTVTLRLDLPRQQLEIPREIAGQALTEEQRQRLAIEGTAGLVRGLRDPQGQPYNGFVGVDPVMRRLVVLPEKAVTFQDTIAGVKLSAEQSRDLREGKAVPLAQMRRPGGGRPFDGTVQVQAAKAGVEVKPAPHERAPRQAPQATQTVTQKVARQRAEVPKPAAPKATRGPRP